MENLHGGNRDPIFEMGNTALLLVTCLALVAAVSAQDASNLNDLNPGLNANGRELDYFMFNRCATKGVQVDLDRCIVENSICRCRQWAGTFCSSHTCPMVHTHG